MITFLIPTYKEFSNIELIVNKINNLYLKQSYNIFFIDDDSKDGSSEKFKMLKNNNKNIDYHIRKSFARDLTQSVIHALKFIHTEYIIIIDCDLQHDANAIPIMVDSLINQNYDLVIGCRDINKISQFNRRYISFFGILLTKLTGIPTLKDPLSGFFGIKTLDFKKVSSFIKSRGYKVLLSIIFYLPKDIKIKEINTNFYERQNEQSKLNLKVKLFFLLQIVKFIILRLIK